MSHYESYYIVNNSIYFGILEYCTYFCTRKHPVGGIPG